MSVRHTFVLLASSSLSSLLGVNARLQLGSVFPDATDHVECWPPEDALHAPGTPENDNDMLDAMLTTPLEDMLGRFLMQNEHEDVSNSMSWKGRTIRPISELGKLFADQFWNGDSAGLMVSAPSSVGPDSQNSVAFQEIIPNGPGVLDGSASVIGDTPGVYSTWWVGPESMEHKPAALHFAWVGALASQFAVCEYPMDGNTLVRQTCGSKVAAKLRGTLDRCGVHVGMPPYGAVYAQPSFPPLGNRGALVARMKEILAQDRDVSRDGGVTTALQDFVLGAGAGAAPWFSKNLAENREAVKKWGPHNPLGIHLSYNELALTSGRNDVPHALRPHALVYVFGPVFFQTLGQDASKVKQLKNMFSRQRNQMQGLIDSGIMLERAFFDAEDGAPDCLLFFVGTDKSFGLTRLSTAARWIDAKLGEEKAGEPLFV